MTGHTFRPEEGSLAIVLATMDSLNGQDVFARLMVTGRALRTRSFPLIHRHSHKTVGSQTHANGL